MFDQLSNMWICILKHIWNRQWPLGPLGPGVCLTLILLYLLYIILCTCHYNKQLLLLLLYMYFLLDRNLHIKKRTGYDPYQSARFVHSGLYLCRLRKPLLSAIVLEVFIELSLSNYMYRWKGRKTVIQQNKSCRTIFMLKRFCRGSKVKLYGDLNRNPAMINHHIVKHLTEWTCSVKMGF